MTKKKPVGATKKRSPKSAAKKKTAKGSSRWKKFGKYSLVFFLVTSLFGVFTFIYLYATTKIPDPNNDFQTNTTFIYYADGKTQLGSLAVQNRESLSYDQIPQVVKDAVIAAENRTFWTDPGFSISGIARAGLSIARGGEVQGGSTITQQYIKILYLDSQRTLKRKIRELILAIKLGREVPKKEILAGYLNTIYFGRGAYGIQAAAKSFFLKQAKDLSLSEAATLAAILNNPGGLNPSRGEKARGRLLARYRYVLDGMLEMKTISKENHDAAYGQLPNFPTVPETNRYGGAKGFLLKMVEKELLDLNYPESQIQGGGLRITTTIDKAMQDQAVNVAQEYTKKALAGAEEKYRKGQVNVALTAVDTATGGIRALYGGADYVKNSRNWATTPRPAASTFKTFAVVAALRNDIGLNTILNGNSFTPRGDAVPVRNENHHQYGPISLRRALAKSSNTAFVDLTQQLPNGPREISKAANDAGLPTTQGWELNNRIALGTAEVSPVNMANGYATLVNQGRRNEVHIVSKIEDRNGNLLYEAQPANEQKIDRRQASQVVEGLMNVVDEGTGNRAQALNRPVAGKTGTNGVGDQITTAWFVGATRQLATAVLFTAGESGNEDLVPYRPPENDSFFGSGYPLSTWLDFMKVAVKGQPAESFDLSEERPIELPMTSEITTQPQPSPTTNSPTSQPPEPTVEPSVSNPVVTKSPVLEPSTVESPVATTTPTASPSENPKSPKPKPTKPSN